MIAYENIPLHDGKMYWDRATALRVDPDTFEVRAYQMRFPERRQINEDGDTITTPGYATQMSQATVALESYGNWPDHRVLGAELLTFPEWTISRFPVEYVPLNGGTELVRIKMDAGRRAYKGMAEGYARALALVDAGPSNVGNDSTRGMLRAVMPMGIMGRWQEIVLGICEVLSYGTPDVARRVVPLELAQQRARTAVRSLFSSERTVVVPDFPVAIIKHRSRKHEALVLFHGRYIGKLCNESGELVYYATTRVVDRDARKHAKHGLARLARTLFADRIVWPA